ncbi:T9SS type B sorting domain-containing protein [Flagellimonas sp. HMM57]|uniref:T9SS type B sorting domain-containing protein n=1 Tax=unclassified Flagellimonas TaxID=2644544 RepID=UPI0013D89227|nr:MULTISPECIES: T9SS type B sorting domain-containing protein [unclassified Flagellimonas]UII75188.1 T9SS type B sorting domain-containing protein [Flagellimonas sp. HMM57]
MLKKLLYIGLFLIPIFAFSQRCPSLLNPLEGVTGVPIEAVISWEEIPGVAGYSIAIGTTAGAQDIQSERNVGSANFFTPPVGLPSNTQIHVTITLLFFDGTASIVCPSKSFTTENVSIVPDCTTLRNPIDGEIDVNFRSNIRWNYAPKATDYRLSIGTSMGGSEIFGPQNIGNVLTFDPPNDFPLDTEIFVTIIPFNTVGDATNCTVQSFTTQDIQINLGCTRLISPQNGDSDVPLTVILQWEPVSGARSYLVSLGTTPDGREILREREVFDTMLPVLEFEANRSIFITIIPKNELGEALNCQQEVFSTALGCGPFLDRTTGEIVTLFPELDVEENIVICENSPPITLSTNTIAETYRWASITSGGTEIELLSETSEVEISEGGLYRLDVTNFADPNGNNIPCTSSQEFMVDVISGPNINSIDVERDGDNLRLTVNVSGNSQYDFALNDINGPYQDSNIFTNVPIGNNTVYVRDKNEDSCILSEDVEQDLISEGFPKFFTPNGDGINDFWQFALPPNVEDFEITSISIFDRYGNLISQITSESVGWGGLLNGRPLPSSDYWYRAIGIDKREFKGHFTLRR